MNIKRLPSDWTLLYFQFIFKKFSKLGEVLVSESWVLHYLFMENQKTQD